ncbi:MAG: hypothetical protein JXR14_06425 [Paracoccaceae bacterium]
MRIELAPWVRLGALVCLIQTLPTGLPAQSPSETPSEATAPVAAPAPTASAPSAEPPFSAIEWLSDIFVAPGPGLDGGGAEDAPARSASPEDITTSPIGQVKTDAVGLLPTSVTGLPSNFWGPTGSDKLVKMIRAQRVDMPPPLLVFLRRLLLAELDPPIDSGPGAEVFLTRIDKLLDMGALDPALALIERSGPDTPALFRRWFDIRLLSGREEPACARMLAAPDFAPTYPARIFCLARSGDWDAAVLTLGTAQILGLVTDDESALLSRFLDPSLFEGEPFLPYPSRVTPLNYRMHGAIGEPLSLGTLPNAFAYAALDSSNGWKIRLAAAERLVRGGAIPAETLMSLYLERGRAASGGVWDRVQAVQDFEAALDSRDPSEIAKTLPDAIRSMRRAGLLYGFAQAYGERLLEIDLSQQPESRAAARLILMSPVYETAARSPRLEASVPPLWIAIAKGDVAPGPGNDALETAVIAGFSAKPLPPYTAQLLEDGQLGAAALKAMSLLEDGAQGDPLRIEQGLALLRALRLEDIARRTALYLLLNGAR